MKYTQTTYTYKSQWKEKSLSLAKSRRPMPFSESTSRKALAITQRKVKKYKTFNVLDLEGIPENIILFFREMKKG